MGHKRHLDLLLVIEPAVALEWLPRSFSDQLLLSGQAQQNNGRCQPQAKSGQVQPDPPLHAVNDVVIFCIHNFTPLYLIGREGQRRVSSSASPLHTCSDTKPPQRRFLKMCARVSGWVGCCPQIYLRTARRKLCFATGLTRYSAAGIRSRIRGLIPETTMAGIFEVSGVFLRINNV